MFARPLAVCCAALLLVACQPTAPTPSADAPPPSASDSETPFPRPLEVTGELTEGHNALHVISALDAAVQHRPALKLDVTSHSATLIALGEHQEVLAYRWADGALDTATTDFQYLNQATFSLADFPLHSIGAMFTEAEKLGVKGDLVYQIQEYGQGAITQSIASRPETLTVFFQHDGTPVPIIGVSTPSEVRAGLQAVTAEHPRITQFGYSKARGYWSFSVEGTEVVTRIRKDGIPTFETRAERTTDATEFDSTLIDPATAVMAVTIAKESLDEQCELTVDQPSSLTKPVMTIKCAGRTQYVDLRGVDITDELEEQ